MGQETETGPFEVDLKQFRKIELGGGVVLLLFRSERAMARHLVRPQEYYENPELHHRRFSLAFHRRWYLKRFSSSVEADWLGCAFPFNAVKPFIAGEMGRLTPEEKTLIRELDLLGGGVRYVIAAKSGEGGTIRHELMHALFYSDHLYRSRVKSILASLPKALRLSLSKTLTGELGYAKFRVEDEMHAYIVDGLGTVDWLFGRIKSGKDRTAFKRVRKRLLRLFQSHLKRRCGLSIGTKSLGKLSP